MGEEKMKRLIGMILMIFLLCTTAGAHTQFRMDLIGTWYFNEAEYQGERLYARDLELDMTIVLNADGTMSMESMKRIVEVLDEEFIYSLRTKGFREWIILLKSALKNAFLPIISILGLGFGHMLGGSVVVENIFSIPGLGSFLTLSINRRDYPVIQAYILLMALVFVLINYLVDIVSGFLDPRIKWMGGRKS